MWCDVLQDVLLTTTAHIAEEGGDREGAGSEVPSLLSYTLRYIRRVISDVIHT